MIQNVLATSSLTLCDLILALSSPVSELSISRGECKLTQFYLLWRTLIFPFQIESERQAAHRSCDQKWMCQLLSPNSHGCNHSCFCVPEEIGMFTAFQCSRKETMASEMQTCSHVWKCTGRAQKCAQTCVFTLRQRGCQREQAENVFAGRKCDWRGGIWNHTEAEDKVCVQSRRDGSSLSVPGLSTRMWGWVCPNTSGSGLGEAAHALCAVHSYYWGR